MKRYTLKKELWYETYWSLDDQSIVCADKLAKFFWIPDDTNTIDIILSKRPRPESFVITTENWNRVGVKCATGMHYYGIFAAGYRLLIEFGSPCYVSVEI